MTGRTGANSVGLFDTPALRCFSLNPWIDDFGRSSVGLGELRWGVDAVVHA